MLTIGVITRGKYGARLLNTIEKYTDFVTKSDSIPLILPNFIEDPASFVDDLALDNHVFGMDLVITYSLHPDVTPEIVNRAAQAGTKAVIIPGGRYRAGDPHVLDEISKRHNIRILIEDICCAICSDTNPEVKEFSSRLSCPVLQIEIADDKISEVIVIKGAPCGSTWLMAKNLIGVPVIDAPAKAGLLVQQYPCRAVRGTWEGIHNSAQLHKKAMEDAIKKYYEKG
ncbi:MAG TPA: DUF166 family protein [Candidatus Nanoarchaeia archaeon]|nr:DUF166 family protein [Candidatus Nanoarchaeia archaeon]